MTECEDLSSNKLFQFLESGNALDQAAAKKYVVVVPVNESLSLLSVNRELALTHILAASGRKNTYYTLNKQMATLNDDTIEAIKTPSGFDEARTVNILAVEQYYTESFESFTVIRVDQPLAGRVCPKYLSRLSAQNLSSVPVPRRAVDESVSVLTTVLEDSIRHVIRCHTLLAKDVMSRYVVVRGFESDFASKLHAGAARVLQYAIQQRISPSSSSQATYGANTNTANGNIHISLPPEVMGTKSFHFHVKNYKQGFWTVNVWRQVQVACATVLFCQLHSHAFQKIQSFYVREDQQILGELVRLHTLLGETGVGEFAGIPEFVSKHSSSSGSGLSSPVGTHTLGGAGVSGGKSPIVSSLNGLMVLNGMATGVGMGMGSMGTGTPLTSPVATLSPNSLYSTGIRGNNPFMNIPGVKPGIPKIPIDSADHPFFSLIGLRPSLRIPLHTVLPLMSSLMEQPCALSCLSIIDDINSEMMNIIRKNHPNESVAADDTLSLLIYLFVATLPVHLHSLSVYMRHMRPQNDSMGYLSSSSINNNNTTTNTNNTQHENKVNEYGLPTDPAACMDMGKLDSLCTAVEGAVGMLLSGFSKDFGNNRNMRIPGNTNSVPFIRVSSSMRGGSPPSTRISGSGNSVFPGSGIPGTGSYDLSVAGAPVHGQSLLTSTSVTSPSTLSYMANTNTNSGNGSGSGSGGGGGVVAGLMNRGSISGIATTHAGTGTGVDVDGSSDSDEDDAWQRRTATPLAGVAEVSMRHAGGSIVGIGNNSSGGGGGGGGSGQSGLSMVNGRSLGMRDSGSASSSGDIPVIAISQRRRPSSALTVGTGMGMGTGTGVEMGGNSNLSSGNNPFLHGYSGGSPISTHTNGNFAGSPDIMVRPGVSDTYSGTSRTNINPSTGIRPTANTVTGTGAGMATNARGMYHSKTFNSSVFAEVMSSQSSQPHSIVHGNPYQGNSSGNPYQNGTGTGAGVIASNSLSGVRHGVDGNDVDGNNGNGNLGLGMTGNGNNRVRVRTQYHTYNPRTSTGMGMGMGTGTGVAGASIPNVSNTGSQQTPAHTQTVGSSVGRGNGGNHSLSKKNDVSEVLDEKDLRFLREMKISSVGMPTGSYSYGNAGKGTSGDDGMGSFLRSLMGNDQSSGTRG